MFESIWPDWVVREGKIEPIKTLLLRLFESIKKTPNISPE